MALSDLVKHGASHEPLRVFLHGVEGIGKTTFASGAPNAVFVGPEDGGGDLDIARITVTTWEELLGAVSALTNDPHTFATVVFDTADFIERMCHAFVGKGKSIESFGFGKGYKMAAEEQVKLIQSLDALRAKRRVSIIALAHTGIVKFDDPTESSYDRYQPRMHKESAGLWTGWADVVLFANYDVKVRVADGGNTPDLLKKGKAVDRAPDRILYTERRPAFDAKNRYSLPFEIPLSWEAFAKAIRWDERDAKCRARPLARVERDTNAPPTVEDVSNAMRDAKGRGWTTAQLMEVVDSFGAAKGSEIAPDRRAGAIRAFSGSPLSTNHPEAK